MKSRLSVALLTLTVFYVLLLTARAVNRLQELIPWPEGEGLPGAPANAGPDAGTSSVAGPDLGRHPVRLGEERLPSSGRGPYSRIATVRSRELSTHH